MSDEVGGGLVGKMRSRAFQRCRQRPYL